MKIFRDGYKQLNFLNLLEPAVLDIFSKLLTSYVIRIGQQNTIYFIPVAICHGNIHRPPTDYIGKNQVIVIKTDAIPSPSQVTCLTELINPLRIPNK